MDKAQHPDLTNEEKELLYYYRNINGARRAAIVQLAAAYMSAEKQAKTAKYEARGGVLYITPRAGNLQ